MLELVVGHNAINRFFPPLKSPVQNTPGSPTKQAVAPELKYPYCGDGQCKRIGLPMIEIKSDDEIVQILSRELNGKPVFPQSTTSRARCRGMK
jgi:hypothetical protein